MKLPDHLIVMSCLTLSAIAVAWLGMAGPVLSDMSARGIYDFLKDWQTLIGALIALFAAILAIRPVWKQLDELRRQSSQRSYEQLAARSIQLHREREALYLLTSSVELMVKALVAVPSFEPVAGLSANTIIHVQSAHDYLNSSVTKYKNELGPIWGTESIQKARAEMLDQTLHFCNELTKFTNRISIGNKIPMVDVESYSAALLPHKLALFNAANRLHQGITIEAARIGPLIAKFEADLLQ